MKAAGWALLALAGILVGCDKSDEHAKLKAEVDAVYQRQAERQQATPVRVGNLVNGKQLAERCVKCHGLDGVAGAMGAPFIAGLSQNYLVSAMLAYRDGSRDNVEMKKALDGLSPNDIADVSDYYASLDSAWHGEHVGFSKKTQISLSKENIRAGALIAERCNSCHGPAGVNVKDREIPALAGMPPEYFIYALNTYFNGQRDHHIMKLFKLSMDQKSVEQLAAYYAVQTPHTPALPSKGNYAAGERAAAQCAGCHGLDGNVLNPAIPNLAGQPAEYLLKAIHDYRDGKRRDKLMKTALAGMSDKTIQDLAFYYAKQKPESIWQSRARELKTFDPIAQGQKIADSCNGCHGPNGNSKTVGTPSLTGLSVRYFVQAAAAYRDGQRAHEGMQKVVGSLSDTDFEKAGFYYGLQTPVRAPHTPPAGTDLAAGKKLAGNCTSCHGENGISADAKVPSLAGQDAVYLISATQAYASGKRHSDAMKTPASEIKAAELQQVAYYFASLPAQAAHNRMPNQPQLSITEKCNRCHGENGNSNDPFIPPLAGQSEAYLALALKEYQDGRRKHKAMNAMSDVLSLVEIKAIASHYAKQTRVATGSSASQ